MPHRTQHRAMLAGWSAAAVAVFGVWAAACGDGSTAPPSRPPPPPPPANRPPAVSETIPAVTLGRGDTLRVDLSARFRDPDGDGLTFTAGSSDEAVVSVSVSGSALTAVAVERGAASVAVTAADPGGLSASQSFAVTIAIRIANVAVAPDYIELTALEEMVQLSAEAFEATRETVPGTEFSWSSGETAVATVDTAGVVTATGWGETTVVATADGVSGMAVVSVAPTVHAIRVTPREATVAPGDTVRLSAAAADRNGYPVAGAALVWASGDPAVATVDVSDPPVSARVRGVGEGSATIRVSAGDVEGGARITVSADADRVVLSKLYETTGGPNWAVSTHWLTDAPLGNWHGVEVDALGRVTRLRLDDNGLTGEIPPELGLLDQLTALDLGDNRLSGLIPPELGSLTNLEALSLDANRGLAGRIPAALGSLVRLRELRLGRNRLSGPIPPELGSLRNLSILSLWANQLTGPIPPAFASLVRLRLLSLSFNGLTGPIPPWLGSMSALEQLYLRNNALAGPMPPELADLSHLRRLSVDGNELTGPIPRAVLRSSRLDYFRFHHNRAGGEDALCAPGTREFVEWLEGVEESRGPFCNAADVEVLGSFHDAAGGSGWTSRGGWLDGPALGEWHGVTVDSLGRVVALDLSANQLFGGLHPGLVRLRRLRELRVDGNALRGRLQLDLAQLPLRVFHYSDTQLCSPADPGFQAWLGGIASHEGTELTCDALTDLDVLVTFYGSTGGPGWVNADNWLTDASIGEWNGVTADDMGRVTRLELEANNLTGSIPREIAALERLEYLSLRGGSLSGSIPPELGSLRRLAFLLLSDNRLTGPIPPELGSVTRLTELSLSRNALTGRIPPELGSLSSLRRLVLGDNRLTGRIPPELTSLGGLRRLLLGGNRLTGRIPPGWSDLTRLQALDLSANELTGTIPAGLAELTGLQGLLLHRNGLTGPVPHELGNLDGLTHLLLFGNTGLSGPLPGSLTGLGRLRELQAGDTGLCAPSDADFGAWLRGVSLRRVVSCEGESMAYLTQGAQSREFPVPLVADREALLRVFVTATSSASATMPPVLATFFMGGAEVHATVIPRGAQPIPGEIDESALSNSANMPIPARIVQPGLEMVIEIDPDGMLDASLGVRKRIPASGRIALDVRSVPVMDLTLIPFLWTGAPDSSIVETIAGLAADSASGLVPVHQLLPVRDLAVTAHEPVWTSSDSFYDVISQTEAIRIMEGGSGYYMGMLPESSGGIAGLAYGSGRSSVAIPDSTTIAHELGHNLSLDHAPCGSPPGLDPAFPQADGSTGVWGYEFQNGGRLLPPSTADFMSYCDPVWTSDHNFGKALSYRSGPGARSRASASAAPTRSLLLWGGAKAGGELLLEPAFVVDAPPVLPAGGGDFRLEGTDAMGRPLFSLDFDMARVADGDGQAGFAFALPVRPEWAGAVAAITLTGPDGSVTLDRESDRAAAILRDPRSGRVRGILREMPAVGNLRAAVAAAVGDLSGPGAGEEIEVQVSRGIPEAAAWRR